MKFSAQEEYGIRCMMQLARVGSGKPLTIAEIAESEGLSVPYVGKLMAMLRQGELVTSVRGRHGGYALARPADEITVADVMAVLGEQIFDESFCGRLSGELKICVHNSDCAIRSLWTGLEALMRRAMGQIRLADLVRTEGQMAADLTERWPVKIEG